MILLCVSAAYAFLASIAMRFILGDAQPEAESSSSMSSLNDVSGTAALAICESLLLALNDRKVLPEFEILGILEDAAQAHSNVPNDDPNAALHTAVAALINGILDGGNSVRRP